MAIFINGLPVITLELKNPWTGQTVKHAIKQYQSDRDPKEPLFAFGCCIVHFADDPDFKRQYLDYVFDKLWGNTHRKAV